MENWRPVVGCPSYEVSDQGQVSSKFGRILTGYRINGYALVGLQIDKKQIRFLVHRLVAAAFIGPCPDGKEVDHINNIRTDNRAVNLHYLTRSENNLKRTKLECCTSPYIGVSINKITKRWEARAHAEKQVYLGTFGTEEEAARARDKFCRDRGQLVVFNFPE